VKHDPRDKDNLAKDTIEKSGNLNWPLPSEKNDKKRDISALRRTTFK
jgi:hypothetical protein